MNWWTGTPRVPGKLNAESPLGRLVDIAFGSAFALIAILWFLQPVGPIENWVDIFGNPRTVGTCFGFCAIGYFVLAFWPPIKS